MNDAIGRDIVLPAVGPADDFFERVGDMLTPRELRGLDLRRPENRATRDKWLAEYERDGVGEDRDPSFVVLHVGKGEHHDG